MVAAIQAYSHQTIRTKRLFELVASWDNNSQSQEPIAPRSYRTMQHLRSQQVDELVAAYQAGTTVKQLAKTYSVHRNTVSKHLRSRGIDATPPGLTPDQLAEAITLYQAGAPLSRISGDLDVPQSTLREHLIAAGVRMREARKQCY